MKTESTIQSKTSTNSKDRNYSTKIKQLIALDNSWREITEAIQCEMIFARTDLNELINCVEEIQQSIMESKTDWYTEVWGKIDNAQENIEKISDDFNKLIVNFLVKQASFSKRLKNIVNPTIEF